MELIVAIHQLTVPGGPQTYALTVAEHLARCFGGSDGLCVAITWESVGVRADGSTFPRSGRATLVLAGGKRLKAVHSHFSLDP